MPLSKLYQFAHCALLYAGCDTKWARKTDADRAADAAALRELRAMREKRTADNG